MNQIWKYDVVVKDTFKVEMPVGSKFLHVDRQGSFPVMWWLVDPRAKKVTREFLVIGTGHTFEFNGLSYLGTWLDAPFVWHLFLLGEV